MERQKVHAAILAIAKLLEGNETRREDVLVLLGLPPDASDQDIHAVIPQVVSALVDSIPTIIGQIIFSITGPKVPGSNLSIAREASIMVIKRLRTETGCGLAEAHRALRDAEGDFDAAMVLLRERVPSLMARKGL